MLLGNGDGTFQPAGHVPRRAVGTRTPSWRATSTATASSTWPSPTRDSNDVSVLLGNGDGTFVDPGQFVTTPHATPLVADVNGDGTDDVLVVDGAGDILYRQGIPGQPGTFEPPVTVNPGYPSRDIAWVPNTDQGPLLASVDAQDDAISFYAYRDGELRPGRVARHRPAPGADHRGRPQRHGLDDLVVRNAGDGTLSVFFGSHASIGHVRRSHELARSPDFPATR